MERPYRHILLERQNDVCCVRLRSHRMDETDILELADELGSLISDKGCRKMALSLGPGQIYCLYSVFLAKIVTLRRLLTEQDGRLAICEATPETIEVFDACHLKDYFDFAPDVATAVARLSS
jgi:anti-anti-sigma factor